MTRTPQFLPASLPLSLVKTNTTSLLTIFLKKTRKKSLFSQLYPHNKPTQAFLCSVKIVMSQLTVLPLLYLPEKQSMRACVSVCACSTLKLTDTRSGFQQALTTGPARQTELSFSLHPPACTDTYSFSTLPAKKEQQ